MFQLLGLLMLTVAGGMTQVDGAITWYGKYGISNTQVEEPSDADWECEQAATDAAKGAELFASDIPRGDFIQFFQTYALPNVRYWFENEADRSRTANQCGWTMSFNGETMEYTRIEGICHRVEYRYVCYRRLRPCLPGQVRRSSLPRLCFKYVAEKMNMSEAVDHCTTLTGATGASGHIMEMTDVARRDLAMAIDQDIQIWIGLKKNAAGDWDWVHSGLSQHDTETFWNTGEPSGDGDCVNTYLYDREKWADTLCRIKRAFICEFEAV